MKNKEIFSFNFSPKFNQSQKRLIQIDIKKYLTVLWKNKIWIILISFLIAVVWSFVFPLVKKKFSKYTTSAIIKFDDSSFSDDVSTVSNEDFMAPEGKVAIIYTYSFLERVVDTLNYNLFVLTHRLNRSELLKNIKVSRKAKYGEYKIKKSKNSLEIFYTNANKSIENRKLETVFLTSDSLHQVSVNGFEFTLNKNFFNLIDEISLFYAPKRYAINALSQNIFAALDWTRTLLTISYSDKDPQYSAEVTNTISKIFVQQLLEYKHFHTNSRLTALEKQLKVANEELEKSDKALQEFQEKNPYVTLGSKDEKTVKTLINMQDDAYILKQNQEKINTILNKRAEYTGPNSRIHIYQELLDFLGNQNVTEVSIYIQQFNRLNSDKQELLGTGYSNQSSQLINVDNQIKTLEKKIDNISLIYLTQLNEEIKKLQRKIRRSSDYLRDLPKNQLQLAELQRDQQIKEYIHSNISVRYNEAKVNDASIIPDAYIIDEARPPLRLVSMTDLLQIYLFGAILGLFISVVLFLGLEVLNPKIRTIQEVERKLSVPVLGTVPVIQSDKKLPRIEETNKRLDPKLITSDYAPRLEGEVFRRMRIKMLTSVKNNRSDSFLITSLNPEEGKSLISSNLAIVFAQQKYRTLLVDCDLRRGVLHNSFSCNKKPGLTNFLMGNSTITQKIILDFVENTHIPNLSLLTSGEQVPNPSELIGSERMSQLYKFIQKNYDIVIFDTPPFKFISDAFVLNDLVHKMIIVSRYGKTPLKELNDYLMDFSHLREDFKGVIINASKSGVFKDRYHYSYYHY